MSDNSSFRILVVEDEPDLRNLYVDLLTGEGYQVDQAADGQEGFEFLKKGGYDLVLLDLMLPKVDGISLLHKLQTDTPPVSPNKKIIVITNLGQESAISDAVSMGVSGYLVKSDYTPGQILEKVRSFLTN